MEISLLLIPAVNSFANIFLGKIILEQKRRKVSETEGKKIQILGFSLIVIISLYCIFFVFDPFDHFTMKWFWLTFIVLTGSFQSYLEWRFVKGSKEYIVSLIAHLISIIYIFIFIF